MLKFSTSQFKTERDSVATGGIKYNAGSEFATAVYKKRYIREQIHNHDRALSHPPQKKEKIYHGNILIHRPRLHLLTNCNVYAQSLTKKNMDNSLHHSFCHNKCIHIFYQGLRHRYINESRRNKLVLYIICLWLNQHNIRDYKFMDV